ncbi:MAG TPA: phosphoribosylformylglycinamidine cyclo-ligase [Terriglobia bacterium]|nr:phosphoribosylformylglycinamidine cyclo-ligase [Terriglobia bacterium]
MRYRDAGVDIAAATQAKREIKELARRTFNPRVLRELGAFGGFFSLAGLPRDAVLVTSMDGVGTKLKIAFALHRHESVGADIVNHCVNDISVHGAAPLFFLDYIATGKLAPRVVAEIVGGITQACRAAGCALVGGETAEMPGFYSDNEYDLAGCIVGWVRRAKILDGRRIRPGDVILGLPSLGLHTNGYSLARKVLLERCGMKLSKRVPALGRTLGEELLAPHRSYAPALRPLLDAGLLRGLVHVTGGGITENTPRILPAGCAAEIRLGSWPVLPVFDLIARRGRVPEQDMLRTFNMGLGMLLVVAKRDLDRVSAALQKKLEKFWLVGRIISGRSGVEYITQP